RSPRRVRGPPIAAPPDTGAAQRQPAPAMDVSIISTRRGRGGRLATASVALVATLIAASGNAAGADVPPDVAVKAALLYNFAKFAEWPGLPSSAPIAFCVVGDDGIASALLETVRGQNINGHMLEVAR